MDSIAVARRRDPRSAPPESGRLGARARAGVAAGAAHGDAHFFAVDFPSYTDQPYCMHSSERAVTEESSAQLRTRLSPRPRRLASAVRVRLCSAARCPCRCPVPRRHLRCIVALSRTDHRRAARGGLSNSEFPRPHGPRSPLAAPRPAELRAASAGSCGAGRAAVSGRYSWVAQLAAAAVCGAGTWQLRTYQLRSVDPGAAGCWVRAAAW